MEAKEINYNRPQQKFILRRPKSATNLWSRGTGKSVLIGWLMHLIIQLMPKSSWAIVGKNYQQIMTRTLPSTVSGLRMLGYTPDKHFVVRKKPLNDNWYPHEMPLDFDNYISTYSGAGFHLVSQAAEGRGLNVDGIIVDESLRLDKEKFDMNVKSTNRGNLRYFSDLWFHHGIYHFSSMPYGDSKWLLDYGKYYDYDFRSLRRQIAKVQLQLVDSKDPEERVHLYKEQLKLKKHLRFYNNPEDRLYYSEADIFDNLENVGIDYVQEQRRDLMDFIFCVEILNYFPDHIEDGFYPTLDLDFHAYPAEPNEGLILGLDGEALNSPTSKWDGDCVPTLPLHIGVDFGAKINCMNIAQHYKSINTVRFIKNLYVKHPKIIDDLANEFCDYYSTHSCRDVYFAYDVSGNQRQANSKLSYAEQFAKILHSKGWNVILSNAHAYNLTQHDRYLLWGKILKENDPKYPRVRFNKDNCKATLTSMSNAPAKEGTSGLIEKVKSSERSTFLPQEEATHLSDSADYLICSITEIDGMTESFTDIIN